MRRVYWKLLAFWVIASSISGCLMAALNQDARTGAMFGAGVLVVPILAIPIAALVLMLVGFPLLWLFKKCPPMQTPYIGMRLVR